MSDTPKVLGQANPVVTTLTDLYVVPAATAATLSTLIVCNRSASPTTFRVSIAAAGAADNVKQYLWYDLSIVGNDTFAATIGLTLGPTDVVRCYSGAATLSFNLFGIEST